MSLQWTIIASFLYAEIAFVLLLTLPIASPSKWQRFFKSKFLAYISGQASIYFLILIGVLVLCLLDAIREMQKYSNMESSDHQHLDAEMQGNMRLFRAQRNFYISGFALFLLIVIRRLIQLISELATVLATSEANFRQAQSATVAARSLLEQQGSGDEKNKKEIEDLKSQISQLEKDLAKEKKDKEAVKSQAESLNREYDRLAEEHSILQKKITVASGDKKDE
ncbi:PREDICTED: B-cell receptor-associated protein 31 [Papilio xuthus]|uniref:Endoplasmic reticulum transmembrane protein n=1 Tax=Papilio xuthus TaxID=66420 RepID=I4DJV6_PAPXU|nr:B-cell receptor-associated protein 31 [Papilio xuthus]XP_013170200.1 PREDICTED: B-cell receptor-associated protein 31 [Papilio xuthus]BAM18196.1 bcr-associated protein, bap [Papilio xuthus]